MFISFEGIDGSGKTTQLGRLAARLRDNELEVVPTREPGGTRLAEAIRALLLEGDDALDARAELLLFGASRAAHVAQIIRPALNANLWVLSDRFADSSLAYQGAGLGLGEEFVRSMNGFATGDLAPKQTFFLDVSPEVGLARRKGSGQDRIEARGLEFLTGVRAAYLEIAAREPERFIVVDGAASPDEIEAQIWEHVQPFLVGA
jgi:dTMP kinase